MNDQNNNQEKSNDLQAMATQFESTDSTQPSVHVDLANGHSATPEIPEPTIDPEPVTPEPFQPVESTPVTATPTPETAASSIEPKQSAKSGNKSILITVVVLALLLGGGSGYWFLIGPGASSNEPVVVEPVDEEPVAEPEPEVDEIAPTVVLSSPSAGETVEGIVEFTFTASDDTSLERVELYIDDKLIDTADGVEVLALSWDSTDVTDGNHVAVLRAYDEAGNVASTEARGFVVTNKKPEPTPTPTPTPTPDTIPNTGPGDTPTTLPNTGPSEE